MVVLVEFLGQFIDIVRNDGWRKGGSSLGNFCRIGVQNLHEPGFLCTQRHFPEGGSVVGYSLLISLAQN